MKKLLLAFVMMQSVNALVVSFVNDNYDNTGVFGVEVRYLTKVIPRSISGSRLPRELRADTLEYGDIEQSVRAAFSLGRRSPTINGNPDVDLCGMLANLDSDHGDKADALSAVEDEGSSREDVPRSVPLGSVDGSSYVNLNLSWVDLYPKPLLDQGFPKCRTLRFREGFQTIESVLVKFEDPVTGIEHKKLLPGSLFSDVERVTTLLEFDPDGKEKIVVRSAVKSDDDLLVFSSSPGDYEEDPNITRSMLKLPKF